MTLSTVSRIARLYEEWIGYDPLADGWTAAEALENLRDWRLEALAHNVASPKLRRA